MDKRSVVGLAVLVLGSLMLGGIPADAQTPSTFPRTSFEVAAVKVNVTGDSQRPSVWFGLGGRFTARNVTLRTLIEDAYHIMPGKGYVKGGAAWLDTMRFDIDAKAPDEVITSRMPFREQVDLQKAMLQTVLEQRFALHVSRVTKSLPVYRLAVAKGGSKLQKAPADRDCTATMNYCHGFRAAGARAGLDVQTASMLDFADVLTMFADHPVRDGTGLAGEFDIKTTGWASAPRSPRLADGSLSPETIDPSDPSLFTVLEEQLGLKLEPSTGPVEFLVVQSAEQPSAD